MIRFCLALAVFVLAPLAAWPQPGWTPLRDALYLQEVGYRIATGTPVRAILAEAGGALAGTGQGVVRVSHDGTVVPLEGGPAEPVERLRRIGSELYVFTERGLHRHRDGAWAALSAAPCVDVAYWRGMAVVAARDALYRVEGDALAPLAGGAPTPGPVQALAVHAETLYALAYDRLFLFDGEAFQAGKTIEFGSLASKDLRDFVSLGDRLVIGTHQGLGVLRGTAVTHVLAADGLPYDECTAVARGFDDDVWVGTPQGAVRVLDGAFHCFAGPRWLPPGRVNAVDVLPGTARTSEAWAAVGTDGGVGLIRHVPFTLEAKADYYERHLDAWAQKRGPFVHKLEWDGGAKQWRREVSDNDVGWSTHYWAAQAFKFAATGDAVAEQRAIDGFNVMKWTEEVSGIPGFPARSIWAVGETGHQTQGGSGGYAAEWHRTADGKFEWKGDTSSDELDAQFYYAAIFHDLVADKRLKRKAAEHAARIAGHLIDHDWTLCDVDGLPTVWGHWSPAYFKSLRGFYARGLNGLEALNYMRVAHALSGEARFDEAVRTLVGYGYAPATLEQKLTRPPGFVNHSDDRLAFYTYYTLLDYERDPWLRGLFRRGLERSWEVERIERNPWFNFIYGIRTGNPCEMPASLEHLRAWPLDLVKHPYDFESRRDLGPAPGYLPLAGVEKVFSPREIGPARWTNSFAEPKGGSGLEVEDPSGWLDAYWMGRCHGLILPPTAHDRARAARIEIAPRTDVVPYDGPPFPRVLGR